MSIILTVDPMKDLAEIIVSLQGANLNVAMVLENLHIIKLEGDASQFNHIEPIAGIISIEVDSPAYTNYILQAGSNNSLVSNQPA